jgi:hypothetical protein
MRIDKIRGSFSGHNFMIPGWTGITDVALNNREGISTLWLALQYLVEPIYHATRTPFTGQYKPTFVTTAPGKKQITISKVHNIANYAASTLTSFLIPAFEREIVIEPLVNLTKSERNWFNALSIAVAELLKSPVTDLSNVVHSCLLTALHYGNCCLRILGNNGIFSLTEQDIYEVFIDLDYRTRDINRILWRQPDQINYQMYEYIANDNPDFIWKRVEGNQNQAYFEEPIYMNEIVYARFKRDVATCYGVGPGIQNISLIEKIGKNIEELQDVASYQAKPAIVNYVNEQKIQFSRGSIVHLTGNVGTFAPGGVPALPIQRSFSDQQLRELTASYISDLKNAYYSEVAMMPESPNMTAAEVGARLEEKIGLLHPIVQNLQKELIYPIVMAAAQFVIQESRKANFTNTYLKNDAPISIQDLARSQIKYTSRFELMARKRHAEGLNVLTNAVVQAAAIDPSLKEALNLPQFLETVLETFSLDSKLLRDVNE